MGAAILWRTCTAERGQHGFWVTVVQDVRLISGRRVEAARVPDQVFLAELDAVRVDQRLLVALPDSAPALLMRHRQVDEYRFAASLHHSRCPLASLFRSPEAVVDYDLVSGRQEFLELEG